jgi:hypothetical protein
MTQTRKRNRKESYNPPYVEEFVSKMRQTYGYAEKLDTSFGKWDSRSYAVILHPELKIIAIGFCNREGINTFSFDLIYDDRIQTQIPHEDIYDVIQQITYFPPTAKTFTPPTNLKTKSYIIRRLLNSGYYINFLKENNNNIEFGEEDARKWIISLEPYGSSLYIIRYKDGNIRYYDGGQMVPMFFPKLYTESMEVIMTDLHGFGCIGKNNIVQLIEDEVEVETEENEQQDK